MAETRHGVVKSLLAVVKSGDKLVVVVVVMDEDTMVATL